MTDKPKHPKPSPKHQLLEEQLAELKLTQIAESTAALQGLFQAVQGTTTT